MSNIIINKILCLKPTNVLDLNMDLNQFKLWLIGFVDGEGSFTTNLKYNKNKEIISISFILKIGLHKDDINILNYILKRFNLINKLEFYPEKNNKISISIIDPIILKELIIPIFISNYTKYNTAHKGGHGASVPNDFNRLNTKKFHDFKLWLEMFNLNQDKSITFKDKLPKLMELRSKINNYKVIHNDKLLNININPNWLTGFTEAEGCFHINYNNIKKNINLTYILTQRKESIKLFENLLIYFKSLIEENNKELPENIKIYLNKYTLKLYKNKNILRIRISSSDYLYWILFPYLLQTNWNTRKNIDMTLHMVAVIILKHGLHYTPEGLNLILKIKNSMNKKRYMNNNIIPSVDEILFVLSKEPIYNPNISQIINARNKAFKF